MFENRKRRERHRKKPKQRLQYDLCPVTGKRRYGNEHDASVALLLTLSSTRTKNGAELHYYSCPSCHGWHVGHRPRPWDTQEELNRATTAEQEV